jgi:hypothetical protein
VEAGDVDAIALIGPLGVFHHLTGPLRQTVLRVKPVGGVSNVDMIAPTPLIYNTLRFVYLHI